MTVPPSDDRVVVRCPHCAREYRVPRMHLGRQARCVGCRNPFTAEAADAAPPAPAIAVPDATPTAAPAPTPAGPAAALCPVCQAPFAEGETPKSCPDCRAPHHPDCWDYNHGCGMYGCPQAPPTEGLDTTEIPASWWGQEDKACPLCGQKILAAAKRCRFCGAMFESSRPENTVEFVQRTAVERDLPAVRRRSVVLLIFSILSCTAPFAAIIGWVWYKRHREEIARLPALYASIPKIAVAVAVVQTALLVLMAILFSVFRT